jgi:hypothetical protein
MKNLQTLHISNLFSFLSWFSLLQLLSFLKLIYVLALILLFIVPPQKPLENYKHMKKQQKITISTSKKKHMPSS